MVIELNSALKLHRIILLSTKCIYNNSKKCIKNDRRLFWYLTAALVTLYKRICVDVKNKFFFCTIWRWVRTLVVTILVELSIGSIEMFLCHLFGEGKSIALIMESTFIRKVSFLGKSLIISDCDLSWDILKQNLS